MKSLGNFSQRVQVLLKLALRHEEKHHEIDGLIIEGVEIHSRSRTSQGANDLMDQVGRSVRNPNAKTDADGRLTISCSATRGTDRLVALPSGAGKTENGMYCSAPSATINNRFPSSRATTGPRIILLKMAAAF